MHNDRRLRVLEYTKLFVTFAVLAGFLLFTGAPRVRADDSECQHRTERADRHLHDAVDHHGWDSSQANHARHELSEAREYCWNHHRKWYDVEAHEWRTEHNWEDDHGHPQ